MKKRLPVCEIGQMLLSRNNSTGGKSMPGLDEKRGTQRQPILKAGTISFDGSGIDCLVRNMSRAKDLQDRAMTASFLALSDRPEAIRARRPVELGLKVKAPKCIR